MQLAIERIDSEKWQNCIKHVIDVVEPKMDRMDRNLEDVTESFIINVGEESDTTESENNR